MASILGPQPSRIFQHFPGITRRAGPDHSGTAPPSRSGSPVPLPVPRLDAAPEPPSEKHHTLHSGVKHIASALALQPGIISWSTSGPRNIVVFGTSGVGKSSVINMLQNAPGHEDQEPAKVDSSTSGVTDKVQGYQKIIHGERYTVFDTPGLHESQGGKVSMEKALTALHDLLVSQTGGIHLLVLVMRGGRITEADENNYLLAKYLCGDNVPLIFVFTGLENEEKGPEGWWTRQTPERRNRYAGVSDHVCVTAIPGKHDCYRQVYEDSKTRLEDALADTSLPSRMGCPIEGTGGFSTGFKLLMEHIRMLRKTPSGASFHRRLAMFLIDSLGMGRLAAVWFTMKVALPGNFYKISDKRAYSTSTLPRERTKFFFRS